MEKEILRKELKVSAIENGTVIDHIPSGSVFQVIKMLELGRKNKLVIVKEVDFGLYLDGGEKGEILLPRNSVPENWKIGEELDVFIYLDSGFFCAVFSV